MTMVEKTEAVLRRLTPQEEHVLWLRFGIGNPNRFADEAIRYSLTATAVDRIEQSALRKLRLAAVTEECRGRVRAGRAQPVRAARSGRR